MEEFYHSDFEDLLREKADQYKMYPSDKVWKNINHSLRSRRKWYWAGFVILLSGISYLSVTELMKPAPVKPAGKTATPAPLTAKPVTVEQFVPFSSALPTAFTNTDDTVLADLTMEDTGTLTASFDIPLQLLDPSAPPPAKRSGHGSLRIEGLEPLASNEMYDIELSVPSPGEAIAGSSAQDFSPAPGHKLFIPVTAEEQQNAGSNWAKTTGHRSSGRARKINWQLAFSPTTNYRRLFGGDNARIGTSNRNIPLALQIQGNINTLVNHRPALGFELGTHGFLPVSNRITLKGGVQFNYSKYDIRAYRSANELATISLNPTAGRSLNSLTSYTDIRNFGGSAVDDLKNQYFQFSLPVGVELKVLGNDILQFDIAGTLQPTYLLNKNSYLITTDYKNYTRAPSLVRRWNMNAGAEAYLSYNHDGVKWQVGPQFRYQLFSTYDKAYPIKEFLTEFGIKVGITKTIR